MACGHHHQPPFTTFLFGKMDVLIIKIDGGVVKISEGEPSEVPKYLISLRHQCA